VKSTKDRGYGSKHAQLRRTWKSRVEAGAVRCARCGELIVPGDRWDLGHDDEDRSVYSGPEHARCNRRAGGRRGQRVRAQRKRTRVWSREWV
jgi:hypothetical protein